MDNATSSAAAWRAAAKTKDLSAGEPLTLPSGAVVLVRRPPLSEWIAQGRLPQAFAQMVLARETASPAQPPSVADVLALGRFVYALVVATVLQPQIVRDSPAEGEIAYDEVPCADIDAILAYANRSTEVAALGEFHRVGESSGAGADGAPVRPAAERDGGAE